LAQEKQDESVGRLLSDALRIPMEQRVSAYLGRMWRVMNVQDMSDFSSHPAAILSDETYAVFVKLYEGHIAQEQLKLELAGLRLLTERSGVLTPVIIGNIQVGDGSLAVMEAVHVVERERIHWRQIGQALAQLHSARWDRFGLETHGYWGSLYQDNSPLADWPNFFWERRIAPRLSAAVDSGNLPRDLVPQIEKLSSRLQWLCGPKVEPCLLHGDAHQNNFLSTAKGPVMIDPAAYYGHPEIDLAYVDFFAPVSDELFLGYQEMAPLDPGFVQRRDLWRIPGWLGMVQVDGPQHLDKLTTALHIYV
jgi:protein-ribulosamine 3-kinase